MMSRAFSLIEIIASMVILGILTVSLPSVIFTNSKNNETALISQSIKNAKTTLVLASELPWGCAMSRSEATPIFTAFIDDYDNFYDKNGIDVSLRDVRDFSDLSPIKNCGSTRKFQSLDDLDNEIFIARATDLGDFLTTESKIKIDRKNVSGRSDKNFKEIIVETISKDKSGKALRKISFRAYAANIGSEPLVLVKNLQ